MACEELQVGLQQQARPQGSLTTEPRPSSDGFCRSFDFSRPNLVTFVNEFNIVTFAGEQMEAF